MATRKRDYKREREQESQQRKDARVARNRARRKAIREGRSSVGDGTVENHVKPISQGGSLDGPTRGQSRKASNKEGGRLRHKKKGK
jgi:hypothetical protein